jgi:hypothetical protein
MYFSAVSGKRESDPFVPSTDRPNLWISFGHNIWNKAGRTPAPPPPLLLILLPLTLTLPSLLTFAALLLLLPGDRSHHHRADIIESPE